MEIAGDEDRINNKLSVFFKETCGVEVMEATKETKTYISRVKKSSWQGSNWVRLLVAFPSFLEMLKDAHQFTCALVRKKKFDRLKTIWYRYTDLIAVICSSVCDCSQLPFYQLTIVFLKPDEAKIIPFERTKEAFDPKGKELATLATQLFGSSWMTYYNHMLTDHVGLFVAIKGWGIRSSNYGLENLHLFMTNSTKNSPAHVGYPLSAMQARIIWESIPVEARPYSRNFRNAKMSAAGKHSKRQKSIAVKLANTRAMDEGE